MRATSTTTRTGRRHAAAALLAITAATLAGCDRPAGITLAELDRTAPPTVQTVGIEPARGSLAPVARSAGRAAEQGRPARPIGERSEVTGAAAAPPRVAIGRVARLLAGDLLERDAALSKTLPTIVSDRDAIELVVLGKVDFAATAGALSTRELYAGLASNLVGVELVALIVAKDCPLFDISSEQLQRTVTGRAIDWTEFGQERTALTLVVPREQQLRERMARAVVNGDPISGRATQVDGLRSVFDHLLRVPGAMGLVCLEDADALAQNPDVRVLAIDGVRPSLHAFQRGSYPYGTPLNIVTSGAPRGAALQLLQSLQRDDRLPATTLRR